MKLNTPTMIAAFGVGLLLPAKGEIDVIVPTAWKQSNAFNNDRLASNLSNATGMNPGETILYNHNGSLEGEPTTVNGSAWLTSAKANPNDQTGRNTAMADGKVWIVADLGAPYDLTTIRIWNFQWNNTGTSDLSNRGVSQFDLFVRNTAADTNDGTVGGTAINLTSVSDGTAALTNSVAFNPGTSNPWTLLFENQSLGQAPNNDTYTGQSFAVPPGTTARFIAIRVDSSHGGAGIGLGKVRFDVDANPPLLVTKAPADDATDVPTTTNLVATFNKAIQPGTGSITIRRTSDNSVVEAFDVASSPQLTFDLARVTINPTANLSVGTGYYVQIGATAIRDYSSNFFAGIVDPDTTSWSFTTDDSAPFLLSALPLPDATNVPTTTNLVATFSEPIEAGTGNITIKNLTDASQSLIDITDITQVSITGSVLTINPTANLLRDKQYAIRIGSTAIRDLSGNAFVGIEDDFEWSFVTDNLAPTLVSFSPATPTLAVLGTRLLIGYDEAVQAGSGTVEVRKASDNSLVESIDVATPGSVASNGRTVAIVLSVSLEPETAYYVNVSAAAIEDISGNPAEGITGTSAWTFTTSAAVPLVLENFNVSSAPLNGTAADTFAAAITTAGGSSIWVAASGFLENGAVSGTANGAAYLNLGSYINDTKGTAAGKFDLTMTIAETYGNWVSLGFATANTLAIGQNFVTIGGQGTIIYRGQNTVTDPGELDMFGGAGNANLVDGPDGNTGFRTLTVALDLTPAGGYNGTDNFGTVTWSDSVLGPIGSYTYPTTRNFGSLVVSQAATTSTINALALYQTGAPGNTFASWIGGFNVGGLTGINDDFDNDGLGNALENLLGTSPEVFSPGLTAVSASGGNLVFRHTLSATPASDLTGSYEWSTDLVTWNASGVSSGGTTVTFGLPVIITPGTPDLVEVTATVTGTPASKVFARFKATQN